MKYTFDTIEELTHFVTLTHGFDLRNPKDLADASGGAEDYLAVQQRVTQEQYDNYKAGNFDKIG